MVCVNKAGSVTGWPDSGCNAGNRDTQSLAFAVD